MFLPSVIADNLVVCVRLSNVMKVESQCNHFGFIPFPVRRKYFTVLAATNPSLQIGRHSSTCIITLLPSCTTTPILLVIAQLDYHKWREIASVAQVYALQRVRQWKLRKEREERELQRARQLAAISRVKSFHVHLDKPQW